MENFSNGLEQPSYLYGTVHITCDASLDANIQKAMDDTSQLVLELDMDDPNMQAGMMQGMLMKDGKTIKSMATEEEYNMLSAFLKDQLGMPLDMLNTIKPFMVNAMLYPKMLDCPVQSFESELLKVTKTQNEETLGLETVQEQLEVFDAIPYEDQLKDLLKAAKDNLKFDKAFFNKMLEVYDNKDLNGLMEIMNDENYITSSKHADKLINDRNKNWIPKIEDFAKQQPTFFGVGAGHLGGKSGVIKLLRKAGYTVEAVK